MRVEPKERNDKILDLIVQDYIETAEPVGSRTISRRHDLGLSPASIRNVMADLEEDGLICQPHTSAGRVPTDRGYRYWIDALMEPAELTEEEKGRIEQEMSRARTFEALAERLSRTLSEMTENAAVLYVKNLRRVSFVSQMLEELIAEQTIDRFFEEEAELFLEGASRLMSQPEFQDVALMRRMLTAFDDKIELFRVLLKNLQETRVHVHIGSENAPDGFENVSFVTKDCFLGGHPAGGVAVIGPTRIDYSKIISIVEYAADRVSDVMNRY
jgi:transcriptional regulator of heat shock response